MASVGRWPVKKCPPKRCGYVVRQSKEGVENMSWAGRGPKKMPCALTHPQSWEAFDSDKGNRHGNN